MRYPTRLVGGAGLRALAACPRGSPSDWRRLDEWSGRLVWRVHTLRADSRRTRHSPMPTPLTSNPTLISIDSSFSFLKVRLIGRLKLVYRPFTRHEPAYQSAFASVNQPINKWGYLGRCRATTRVCHRLDC